MKFQDSSFNGLKVTVGTKSVTHARSKSNMPHQLFQSWGHNYLLTCHLLRLFSHDETRKAFHIHEGVNGVY